MKLNLVVLKNKPLKNSLNSFLILFAVVTALLAAGSFYYYSSQKNKLIEEGFNYLRNAAEFKMTRLNQWIYEHKADLEILRKGIEVGKKRGNKFYVNDYSGLFESIRANYSFRNIILSDNNYNIIYNTSPDSNKLYKADSILIDESLTMNNVLFSDQSELTAAQSRIRFYLPIKNNYDDNTGQVLILIFNPQKIFGTILNNNYEKSPTLESLLIKTYGDTVVYMNQLKFLNEEIKKEFDKSRKALLQTSSIKEKKGFVEGVDYRNESVIAQIQKVPETAWFLITKIDQSEFYRPVDDLKKITFLSFTTAEFFFILIFFWIWKKNISANIKEIHRAELEKVRLENRFESLVNGVKDIAIFILDKQGNILSWNEGAENIIGFRAAEIIGKNISVFYTKDMLNENLPAKMLKKAGEKGDSHNEGFRIKKDGSLFYASTNITALKDSNNKVYGYLKISRDLTEKRKVEEEIKSSRDFYLKLLDDFPNPVWRSDESGKCNYFNKAWFKFTGRSFEEEKNDGWANGVYPDERNEILKKYYEAFSTRSSFSFELRLRNNHGDYRRQIDFGIPFYDREGKFLGFFGSCYDIEDIKKYEETISTLLRISEKLYSSLEIDQILDSLVTECINLSEAESGYACIRNENKFETKRYFKNDHWEHFEKIYEPEDPFIIKIEKEKEGLIFSGENEDLNINKDIAEKYGIKQAVAIPLKGSSGELLGFFEIHDKKNNKIFSRDDINLLRSVARNASVAISKSLNYQKLSEAEIQLRNSEAELRDLAAQIQNAREAERQRIAREVHDELGQLFTGINLNISLLVETLEQNNKTSYPEILNELYSVQQYVNTGIQTVRNISGSLRSYVLDHLGLIPAINEYCREIERISSIKCEFETEIESLNFSNEKNVTIFRIIQEAITNVVRHAEATLIKIIFQKHDSELRIVVSDNGVGIVPKNQTSTMQSMGIIGMKERTIFLGGKFWVESKKGEGTKIILSIPLK